MNRLLASSFASRLSFFILLLVTLLFVVAMAVVSHFAQAFIRNEATQKMQYALLNTRQHIETILHEAETATINMAWAVEDNRSDTAALYAVTRHIVADNHYIVGSAIAFVPEYFKGKLFYSPYSYLDADSSIQTIQMGNASYNYFYKEWFVEPYLSGKPYWSEPYYDEGGGEQLMTTYSLPLLDDKGEVYAILTTDLNLEGLAGYMRTIQPYPNSKAFLAGHTGTYIVHPEKEKILHDNLYTFAENHPGTLEAQLTERIRQGVAGRLEWHGSKATTLTTYDFISNGWSIFITADYDTVFHGVTRMRTILTVVFILGLVLLSVCCRQVIRRLTRPLTAFSKSARSIASGNFHTPLPVIHSNDEMKQLYQSFDFMQHSLTEYMQKLKQTTAEKERISSELSIAHQIQQSLLPVDFPTHQSYGIYAMVHPAQEVGGDLYDFIVQDDDLFFVIGDVSGKGVPAALFMALTRANLHTLTTLHLPIERMIGQANSNICENNENMLFVTLFAGIIHRSTRCLRYCNAGHNAIVIIPPHGQPYFLQAQSNLPLGVLPGFTYTQQELSLEPGTRLVLYTDGVTEAENTDKELFGNQRLMQWAMQLPHTMSDREATDSLYAAVRAFSHEALQNDDITIMTISI